MTAQVQSFKHLIATQQQEDLAKPVWLRAFRSNARAKFTQLSPPNSRDERYRYARLNDLLNAQYRCESSALPMEQVQEIAQRYQGHVYVFVDGILAATANPLPAPSRFTSFNKLMNTDTVDLSQLLADASEDYFQQLNDICFKDGAHLVIPKDTKIEQPIYLVYVSNTAAQFNCYRNLIEVQAHSQVRIVECYIGVGAASEKRPHLTNASTQIYLSPAAHCTYVKLQSEHAFHISKCDIRQQQGSALQIFALAAGGQYSRMSTSVVKVGADSECDFRYGYLGAGRQTFDCVADVEHRYPRGKTNQLVRGIVKDQARGIFTGKINILQAAQKSIAVQQSKNMLVGKECEVYMRPQLQVKADDVECAHGATSAKISERDLLYLQTRGIATATAMRLISDAHLGVLLNGFGARDLVEEPLRQATANFFRANSRC